MEKTPAFQKYNQVIRLTLLLSLATGSLNGCATNPVTGRSDFVMMSEDKELELGRKYHQQVLKQYPLYNHPELQTYVEQVGEQLARKSHRPDLVYHFYLLDDTSVNAFALPGGYVYITRGILAYLNSEAHLAGILGHEIGHVTARHSVRQHAQSSLMGVLGTAASVYTGSQAVGQLSGLFGTALVRGYGREHELEADRLGAEYLAQARYNPEKMIDVVELLKSQESFESQRAKQEGREPRGYHGLFSTHPRNDKRLQEVIESAKRFKEREYRPLDDETFLKKLAGMTFGPGEYHGVLRGRRFYHKPLDFTVEFPQGWRLKNMPDSIIATSTNNNAAIYLSLRDLNRRQTAEDFLRQNFKIAGGKPIHDNAFAGITRADSPYGKKPVRIAAAFHGKRVFIAVGAKKNGLMGQPFYDTVKSIRHLKPSERELAQPKHIHLIRAKEGDTFAKLGKASPLTNHAEQQLRLLNGLYPKGEPKPGQLIKFVR